MPALRSRVNRNAVKETQESFICKTQFSEIEIAILLAVFSEKHHYGHHLKERSDGLNRIS